MPSIAIVFISVGAVVFIGGVALIIKRLAEATALTTSNASNMKPLDPEFDSVEIGESPRQI
jgi:hypothetical protein